jgi:hypothetical protein
VYGGKNIFQNLFFRIFIVYHIGKQIPEDRALSDSLLRYLRLYKNAQFFLRHPVSPDLLVDCEGYHH